LREARGRRRLFEFDKDVKDSFNNTEEDVKEIKHSLREIENDRKT